MDHIKLSSHPPVNNGLGFVLGFDCCEECSRKEDLCSSCFQSKLGCHFTFCVLMLLAWPHPLGCLHADLCEYLSSLLTIAFPLPVGGYLSSW